MAMTQEMELHRRSRAMFQTIVVPLDGSRFGEQALPLALTLARRASAHLRVVHKHMPPPPVYADSALASDPALEAQSRDQERAYLDAVVQKLFAAGAASASSALVEGPLLDALCGHVAEAKADLVVMTTHGRGPLTRFWLGSVADGLVRRLTVPLLLVRPHEHESEVDLTKERLLRHLLIPLDGTPYAEAILKPALALGSLMGAEYTLLRVIEPVPVVGLDVPGYAAAGLDVTLLDRLQALSRDYLHAVAERLRRQGARVQTDIVINQLAAGAILGEVAARRPDALALQTHGRGGLARLFLGSVADKVLRGATVPVLVQRSPEP
jgi:nucleotide-binding universal stress UspA family protein